MVGKEAERAELHTGAVTGILPPTSRFAADDAYRIQKQNVLDRLTAFFDRYFPLG